MLLALESKALESKALLSLAAAPAWSLAAASLCWLRAHERRACGVAQLCLTGAELRLAWEALAPVLEVRGTMVWVLGAQERSTWRMLQSRSRYT